MGAGHAIPGEPQWQNEAEDAEGWPGLEVLRCDHCGQTIQRLLRCAACRRAFFCGRECQRAAWPRHREVCGVRSSTTADDARSKSPRAASPGGNRLATVDGGPCSTASDAFRRCLDAFASSRFREALQEANVAAESAAEEEHWELHCEALRIRGQCFEQLQDMTAARAALGDALAQVRARLTGAAAAHAEANVLLRLGAVAKRSSRPGLATQYQRNAVALLEANGDDKDTLAAAYNNLGISAGQQGMTSAARAAFSRAVELRKETGHAEGLCACATNLANLLRGEGQPEAAVSELEDARRLARTAGSRRLEDQVLLNLANLYENELRPYQRRPADSGDDGSSSTEEREAQPHVHVPAAEAALRCRRALFKLPEVPSGAAAERQVPVKCGQCSIDLRGRPSHLRCSRCRRSWYCSRNCQRSAWPRHSAGCRAPELPSAAELELKTRSCPVCLEGLALLEQTADGREVTILQCHHCLHTECWSQWSSTGGTSCPVCRDSLSFSA